MPTTPQKILVIRMSAMGDVAMTVPVLTSLAAQQRLNLTLLTDEAFSPMFVGLPQLNLFFIRKRGRHKGLVGLIRLFFDLKRLGSFDAVADLHDVFRSKVLCFLFLLTGVRVKKIDKGRAEKRRLTKRGNGQSEPLRHTINRYHEVFAQLGFNFKIDFTSIYTERPKLPLQLQKDFGEKVEKWVGIAPFAKHAGKIYPLDKMEQFLSLLDNVPDVKIFLFGNGADEKRVMSGWATRYPSVHLMPSGCRLPEELCLMSYLDVMVSMDSANMHLASLVGLPVVSIWGATHYYAGFLGFRQSVDNIVEVDLPCRPCSVYGNRPCSRVEKDYACLTRIEPEVILDKVKRYL